MNTFNEAAARTITEVLIPLWEKGLIPREYINSAVALIIRDTFGTAKWNREFGTPTPLKPETIQTTSGTAEDDTHTEETAE